MNYPLISEYVEAIKEAEDNFEKLRYLRPVLSDDGLPVMTSGNFAVVFKMRDERDGRLYAVKCFTKEQTGRAEAYHQIAEELKDVDSPYLVSLRYLDKELFVDTEQTDETEFPVLLMDWVESKTLDKYLRENLDDKYALEMLAYRFSQLAQWLIPQPFAHGDLKPDNILVREDGSLVLVDYDGMYVPAMKGQKARELGSPDFRHPLRTENDFDEHIDDFPLVSILFSLKAIVVNPCLFEEYGTKEGLLLSKKDYIQVNECQIVFSSILWNDVESRNLLGLLALMISGKRKSDSVMKVLSLSIDNLVRDKDEKNGYNDGNDVFYSQDRKRLLSCKGFKYIPFTNYNDTCYSILNGTEVICDNAFDGCDFLKELSIPLSVTIIGNAAFAGTNRLKSIYIPNRNVIFIGNPFVGHSGEIHLNSNKYSVIAEHNSEDFDYLYHSVFTQDMKTIIHCGYSDKYYYGGINDVGDCWEESGDTTPYIIPNTVVTIGKCAFAKCDLSTLNIPEGVKVIEDWAFYNSSIETIYFPKTIETLGDELFGTQTCVKNIFIPYSSGNIFKSLISIYEDKIQFY